MIKVLAKNNLQVDKQHVDIIIHFVKFSNFVLKFNADVSIYLLAKGQDDTATTGGYDPEKKIIYALYEGRALVDILRSIAHELEHQRQDHFGLIKPDVQPQNIGGFLENDANIIPGILIKLYVKQFKARQIYFL
jgi:hypothetical protein